MDEVFARELEAVDWFAACGQSLAIGLPFQVSRVGSWAEAIEHCSDQSWEDVTLEAQNRLTVFLHNHHRNDYQRWNAIVDTAKTRVVTPLMDRVWRPLAERNGFGKALVDCASWDVLGAIMEHEYQRFRKRPEFSLHLLQVYRAGHFPCGWSEEWPDGRLLVW